MSDKPVKIQIQISVPESFVKFITDLEALGYSRAEMVKSGIRMLHKKELPPYVQKVKTKEMADQLTDEELCIDVFHGEVVEEQGIKVCKIKNGNFSDMIPLSALRGQIPKK